MAPVTSNCKHGRSDSRLSRCRSAPASRSKEGTLGRSVTGPIDTSDGGRGASVVPHRVPGEQRPHGVLGERLGDQEALGLIATCLAEVVELGETLDAFGYHVQAEAVRHRDLGEHQCRIAVVEVANEMSVDLQLVEGVLAQPAERRVPRAEVVDRQPDPEVPNARSVSSANEASPVIKPSVISKVSVDGSR